MVDYLFLNSGFSKFSGPNNHILDLSNYLYTKSKKSLVLVTHRRQRVVESDFLREIRFPTTRILERAADIASNVKAIRNVFERLSPRVIFVNCDINLAFQTFFATSKRLHIGYNVFLGKTELSLNRHFFRSVYLNLLNRLGPNILMKEIVAHTNWHRKAYINRIGIDPNKITVIPHCVDLNRIQQFIEQDFRLENNEAPLIMFVGRLKRIKGIIELLEAYEQISKKTDANLLIVGGGPLEERVQEMKRRIEIRNTKAHIICKRRVPLARLISLMNSVDVIAIPSYSEPFGLVALEAMSLKKVVVATCFGGISEVITNEVDGILVNPFDSQQLQTRLEELVSDTHKRNKLGRSAYQTIRKKYDVSVVAPKFINFLEGANIN